MTFTATGQLDGAEVSLTFDNSDPQVGGIVACSPALRVRLEGAVGQDVSLTVTGPSRPLALDDPIAVLAFVGRTCSAVTVEGTPTPVDVPDVPEGALA